MQWHTVSIRNDSGRARCRLLVGSSVRYERTRSHVPSSSSRSDSPQNGRRSIFHRLRPQHCLEPENWGTVAVLLQSQFNYCIVLCYCSGYGGLGVVDEGTVEHEQSSFALWTKERYHHLLSGITRNVVRNHEATASSTRPAHLPRHCGLFAVETIFNSPQLLQTLLFFRSRGISLLFLPLSNSSVL